MKPKNYSIFLLAFIFLLSSSSFPSCKSKCTTQPTETFLISSSDKAQILYSGSDTLKFLNNATDTIIFIGQGKQHYLDVETGTGGDCPGADKQREEYTIQYKSLNSNSNLSYTYGIPLNSQSGTQINISFDGGSFYNELISLRAPWAFNSIQIARKTYSNIVLFSPTSNVKDSLYYNSQFGILRMSINNNKWEIIKP